MKRLLDSFLWILLSVFSFAIWGQTTKKTLPSHLQKAYVIQKNAIVYARADFDSLQVSHIPAGTRVTISRQIYRPPSRFGTFYRIYINKPKKMKAYISEIDVTPRYIKSGSGYKLNPAFKQVKQKLKYVKDFQFNSLGPEDIVDIADKPLDTQRLIGLLVSHSWLAYKKQDGFFPTWLFGLKLTGPGLPIKRILTDFSLVVSFPPMIDNKIFIDQKKISKAYLLMGDFGLKFTLLSADKLAIYLSGGLMVKMKGNLASQTSKTVEMGIGFSGSAGLLFKIHERLVLLIESPAIYDLSENRFFPSVRGGVLVSF